VLYVHERSCIWRYKIHRFMEYMYINGQIYHHIPCGNSVNSQYDISGREKSGADMKLNFNGFNILLYMSF
jgi:hypothetical protein